MRNSNAQLIWLCHQRTFARCFPALAVWKLWRPCRRKGVSQSHRTVLPLTKDEYITSVKTFAQLNKIDITVQIETSLGRKIKLFIEDKTFSNEHNQLSVYDKFIDDINDYEVYKIFYKTNLIDDEEQKRIQNVNDTNKTDWKIYDIYRIYGFLASIYHPTIWFYLNTPNT